MANIFKELESRTRTVDSVRLANHHAAVSVPPPEADCRQGGMPPSRIFPALRLLSVATAFPFTSGVALIIVAFPGVRRISIVGARLPATSVRIDRDAHAGTMVVTGISVCVCSLADAVVVYGVGFLMGIIRKAQPIRRLSRLRT